jgi:hypothetical protein
MSISPTMLLPSQSDDATLRFIWSTISEPARGGGEAPQASTTCHTTAGRDESKRKRGNINKGNSPARALAPASRFTY